MLAIYCCIGNDPKAQSRKTMHLWSHSFCGSASKGSLAGSSASGPLTGCSGDAGYCWSNLKAQLVEELLPRSTVVGRIHLDWWRQLFAGWSAGGLSSLPRGPLYRKFTTWQLHLSKQVRAPERKRASNKEITILCSPTSEVKSHHFCHILFARSKSLGPAHPQGGDTQGPGGCQEAAIIRNHSKAAQHIHLSLPRILLKSGIYSDLVRPIETRKLSPREVL